MTIITATYNRAHMLPRSIDSVLRQDYPDLRLLIVDDGSTDATDEVLKPYERDSRVKVIRHETNRGVIAARNTAFEHLGDDVKYFGYNDSDDMLLPGAISMTVRILEEHGQRYSMVYARAEDAATGAPQGSIRVPDADTRRDREITYDDCLSYRVSGDWFQLVRRDLLGSMRYDARAGGGEGILWARMLRLKPALVVEKTLQLKDRSGSDRVSIVRYDRDSARARMWIFMHELHYIGDDMRRAHPRNYALLLSRLAHEASMAGEKRRARIASRQAIRLDLSPRTAVIACAVLMPASLVSGATRALRQVRHRRQRPLV